MAILTRRAVPTGPWRPFHDFELLRTRLDPLFDEVLPGAEDLWVPAVDLVEQDDALVLRADVPGYKPEEIKIEVADDLLTVSGSHEETTETTKEHYHRRERRSGSFSRSLALPAGVDPERIEATCAEGVLEVRIPAPQIEPKRRVEITPKASAATS